ncbi:uncharacterized protein EAF01_009822 [Botrytis porri]|uniref:PinX1-related protein 1 n=1 Tax=Botrytis porri TaxID=87229 RepID=A0A4Z1KJQ3_9HELO|nr:uncharacterized protein EAF01_009822 [Botrytis porri]KAF7894371.1 hypothetical protein EAF01_009822 [Botrytis porri]TGO85798.1 hypothetical protein BPOR_0363g00160 [Botrytis porri]
MGLAAPKNKIKLSHDPNNTRWSGNTDSFGHRMMKSQGWTPGEYLGAKDAAHAEFHTEANASHIRVVIKDNTLGLGAKIGSGVGHGECTGLDVFQNLLGRLNGKEEAEIEKEQKGREDLKRAIYAERKWGSIRFVKGGVLIGDKIQDLIDGEKERLKALEIKEKAAENSSEESDSSSDEEEEEKSPEPVTEKKKPSKRKREEQEDEEKTSSKKSKKEKKEKREKKSKKRKSEDEDDKDKSEIKKSKKSKKDRKSKSKSTSESEDETLDESALKARKKEKKEKKRREKEAAGVDTEETTSTSKSSKKSKKDKHKSSSTSEASTKESTPIVSESSARSAPMGIRSIRARHIAQKRMASMDVASLNQIFMIKS